MNFRRDVFRRYLLFIARRNLAWEALQLPLYRLWQIGTPTKMTVAVVHCIVGDRVIASSALRRQAKSDRAPALKDETLVCTSVCHQNRQSEVSNKVPGRTTEHKVSNPTVTITAHNQQLSASLQGMYLKSFTDRAALRIDANAFCLQATTSNTKSLRG